MVGFLLGDGWQETAEMIRLLLPWFLVLVLNAPWNFVPNMYGKQKAAFGIELLYLALRLIVIGIGVYTRNLTVLLLGYSLTGVIIMVILNLWYGKLLAGPQAA
jgi:O-antigen/teichoic acid export membrane protein